MARKDESGQVRGLLTLLLKAGTVCDFCDGNILHTKEVRSGSPCTAHFKMFLSFRFRENL